MLLMGENNTVRKAATQLITSYLETWCYVMSQWGFFCWLSCESQNGLGWDVKNCTAVPWLEMPPSSAGWCTSSLGWEGMLKII